jgi:heme/copper-type cytochrome/quinol oxidase subunit 1
MAALRESGPSPPTIFSQLLGYLIPLVYLVWSMRYGPVAGPNPWGAKGLEWQTPSPPPTENFEETPIVTEEAYAYGTEETRVA